MNKLLNSPLIRRQAIKLYKRLRLPKLVALCNNLRLLYRKPYIKLQGALPVPGVGILVHGWVFDPGKKIGSIHLRWVKRSKYQTISALA